MRLFPNRQAAAKELADALSFLKDDEPLVLGIPNYGVPLAAVIAEALRCELDILLIAKLYAPQQPEQVVGAVDENGRISMIQTAARWHQLTAQQMIAPARDAYAELQRRRARFRGVLPETDVRGRTVIVVDHGVETGATMLAAIASVKDRGATRVVAAAPAGCGKATWQLHETAHQVVIPHTPSRFKGVERFYEVFEDVTDREVEGLLRNWSAQRPDQHAGVRTLVNRVLGAEQNVIHCELDLPPGMTRGGGPYPAVVFAHGFESDGRNERTRLVSRRLAKRQVIGVRLDFTGHGQSEGTVHDATEDRMIADLEAVYENVRILHEVDPARIGLNGSGTGAMVTLRFAAGHPEIGAVVVRGPLSGREIAALEPLKTPALLIHGEHDTGLREAAEAPGRELASVHRLLEIPQSGRWFNDPVSLELMVSASVDWLADHLLAPGAPAAASGAASS